MTERRAVLLLILLSAVIGGLIWFLHHEPQPPSAASPVGEAAPGKVGMAQPPARRKTTPNPARTEGPGGIVLPREAATLARTLNAPEGTGEQDVQTLATLVELFQRANLGAIPAGGLPEEIVEQMLGKNAHHLAVLPADCPGLDATGRLLDRWGTPYFLHPLSREILEIRSAGPDRKMRTADDIVLNDEAGIRR